MGEHIEFVEQYGHGRQVVVLSHLRETSMQYKTFQEKTREILRSDHGGAEAACSLTNIPETTPPQKPRIPPNRMMERRRKWK